MTRFQVLLAAPCGWLIVLAMAGAGETPAFKITADESRLLDLINQERKKEDLVPLKADALLFKAARAHSANMAKQQKSDHKLDGKTPFDRIRETGYVYQGAAENIAAGDAAVKLPGVVKKWMESKGHRANILNGDFTETGLGFSRGQDGQIYYTQVFAKPRTKK
jgi:uncharacterized protein YkwD